MNKMFIDVIMLFALLLKRWLISTTLLLILDALWFRFGAPFLGATYDDMVQKISGKKPPMTPVGFFVYPILGYMLARFALEPNDAAILGLAVFGVYNLSNMFVFDGWNAKVAMLDTAWGCCSLFLVGHIINLL